MPVQPLDGDLCGRRIVAVGVIGHAVAVVALERRAGVGQVVVGLSVAVGSRDERSRASG